jgi:hypothetical protein
MKTCQQFYLYLSIKRKISFNNNDNKKKPLMTRASYNSYCGFLINESGNYFKSEMKQQKFKKSKQFGACMIDVNERIAKLF